MHEDLQAAVSNIGMSMPSEMLPSLISSSVSQGSDLDVCSTWQFHEQ